MTPTKEDVKKWLKTIGKDRFWLSGKLNTPKRTIDNWLAPGGAFPAYAVLQLQKLMNGEAESSPRIVIDFTDEEWDIICEAAKAHKETFLEFVNTAIQNAAKEKEAARKKFTPVETFTTPPLEAQGRIIGNIAAGNLADGRQRWSLQPQNGGISLPPETRGQANSRRKSVLDQLNGQDP